MSAGWGFAPVRGRAEGLWNRYWDRTNSGGWGLNDARYFRRYRASNMARDLLTLKYTVEGLRERNVGLVFPPEGEVAAKVGAVLDGYAGLGRWEPEHPSNDPDDERSER